MRLYSNSKILNLPGYEVYFTRFADSIMEYCFPNAKKEIERILQQFNVLKEDIVKSGGEKSQITKSLEKMLEKVNWTKHNIESSIHVGRKKVSRRGHEIDHYKRFRNGNVGFEIEWNSKDYALDRDLENFRRAHQIGEVSFGVIITRGESLQKELQSVFKEVILELEPFNAADLQDKFDLTKKTMKRIESFFHLPRPTLIEKVSNVICTSKFATSTTHMAQLKQRIANGDGDPCPFVLIGIGKDRLIR